MFKVHTHLGRIGLVLLAKVWEGSMSRVLHCIESESSIY